MIIQFDVDGILAEFMGHANKIARKFDPNTPVVDTHTTTDWDNWEGWSQETIDHVWAKVKDPKELFFYTMPSLLKRDEWTTMRRLVRNNDVYFVTSRPGVTAKSQTEAWLYDRLECPGTVIITADKAGFAKLLKPDWAVEDNGINASRIARYIGVERSCLIDRKYNQMFHPLSFTRLKTMKEFLARVDQ